MYSIVYEPSLKDELFLNFKVINNFSDFKNQSDLIVTNRYCEKLKDVTNKVYTRDLYFRD